MNSLKKQLVRLAMGVGMLIIGSITVLIGLVVALIVSADWLVLCIVGLLVAIVGLVLIVRDISRLSGSLRHMLPSFVTDIFLRK